VIRVQFEADRPDRDDDTSIAGRVEFAAQIADLHVDHVGVGGRLEMPNVLEQHRSGDRLAGTAHEVFEQLEFPRNQVDEPAFAPDRSLDQVHFQIANPEPDDANVAASAQEGLDPRRQFANIEGFDQIVVAAGFQPGDSFIDGGKLADGQRRRPLSFAAQRLDDRKSILAIQDPVDNEDAGVARTRRPEPLGQGLGDLDGVAVGLQVEANLLREFAVVLNHENATGASRLRLFLIEYTQVYRRRKMIIHRFGVGFFFTWTYAPTRAPII